MKNWLKRSISILFLCSLILSFAVQALAVADSSALTEEELNEQLERQPLYPQITGCVELDELLEAQLGASEGKPILERLKLGYAWVIRRILYSWRPYTSYSAPAYDCFGAAHELTYIDGLEEAMPREVINRVYHALQFREGVCYDYAAAFAVVARYLGLEAYVHTGYVNYSNTAAPYRLHHGFTVMLINGEQLIFDPQIDMRRSRTDAVSYQCFGIPEERQWRYELAEDELNEKRDGGFLPVSAERHYTPHIYATSSESGFVVGDGVYEQGERVWLRAYAKHGGTFHGWYDEQGTLCSKKQLLSLQADRTCSYRAVFDDEYFVDVQPDDWYRDLAIRFWKMGLVQGDGDFCFHGDQKLTRAEAVSLLCKAMEGTPVKQVELAYRDVSETEWYYEALTWSVDREIVRDVFPEGDFQPNTPVTRSEFLHMLVHCAWMRGMEGEAVFLPYYDIVTLRRAPIEALRHAQSWGLLKGYEDGSARPHNPVTRAESAQLLMDLLKLLEKQENLAA